MRLPELQYADGISKNNQVKFKGLNHILGAEDGELWDMRNMTGDYYPLLASRRLRYLYTNVSGGGGLFARDELCWAADGGFYYGGDWKGAVSSGLKTFTALGAYIIILPDKAYYNTATDEFGSLESAWSGSSLTFTNGTIYEEEAECNTIQCDGVDWSDYFSVGDAVEISGCTIHTENNKTPIIREIDGDELRFYEYVFTLDGDDEDEPYTETGSLSIKRAVPDMDYICENNNRLWGCKDNTIYVSKLGDPFNWNVYDGLSTDSYAVDTGSAGSFTGCVSYLGYPIFFKQDHIYKVYGDYPSEYQLMESATLGVAEGSARSLAIAGEQLFYLSNAGIMAYSGGIPQLVSEPFGLEKYKNAVGGSDGLKYYVSLSDASGDYRLFVYDTKTGLWHIEDETQAVGFAAKDGVLYYLNSSGGIWTTGEVPSEGGTLEPEIDWYAEFGDFTEEHPNKKGMSKLQIRLELDADAYVNLLLQFDSDGVWRTVDTLETNRKRSYYLPIIPRRSDHYRLKLEGHGGCRIYSITRETYKGSELKSLAGRQ